MTTLTATGDATRIEQFFSAFIVFCADFCAGARQGGYPPSPRSP
jgi:hypothetical protein